MDDVVEPVGDVAIAVKPGGGTTVVSPLIYGFNKLLDADEQLQTLARLGGNRFSAWNWENNASNAGNDLKFQNDGYLGGGESPGGAVAAALAQSAALGTLAVLTVPIGDYVAADKTPPGDVTLTPDYLATRFVANVAAHPGGPALAPDKKDRAVYQEDFVAWTKSQPHGPVGFSLDNEPDLWHSTHKEIHPDHVTYEELVERTLRFSRVVKGVWPEAPVFAFASYGWNGFTTLQNAPDGGGRDFLPFFLDAIHEQEVALGQKLVDFIDLHWYPEAQGTNAAGVATRIVGFSATAQDKSPGVVAARLEAPRSLWDPTYVEQSWITSSLKGEAIALIPRIKAKLAAHAPGTALAIMEWNYGGGGDISGGLVTADVLGIFGREGVGAAAYWPIGGDSYARAAFRAYRNYDDAGGTFGDVQIPVTSSDPRVSVYASLDSARPERMVLVLVNKSLDDLTARVDCGLASPPVSAQSYRLSSLGPRLRPSVALTPGVDGLLSYPMPRRSLTVLALVVSASGGS